MECPNWMDHSVFHISFRTPVRLSSSSHAVMKRGFLLTKLNQPEEATRNISVDRLAPSSKFGNAGDL